MKNFSFYLILGLSFVLNIAVSCSGSSSTDTKPTPAPVDVTPYINAAEQGTWRVTKYSDHGNNKVSHFTGFIFTFGPNNVLTATNGTETHTGEWIISTSPIAPHQTVPDMSPNDPVDFNIYFPTTEAANFTDINDDWDRVTMSDTKMEFIDVSPTPGKEPDYITFEKN